MKRSGRLGKVKVTADGEGVVSHAGAELLREMAGFTGLIDACNSEARGERGAVLVVDRSRIIDVIARHNRRGAENVRRGLLARLHNRDRLNLRTLSLRIRSWCLV